MRLDVFRFRTNLSGFIFAALLVIWSMDSRADSHTFQDCTDDAVKELDRLHEQTVSNAQALKQRLETEIQGGTYSQETRASLRDAHEVVNGILENLPSVQYVCIAEQTSRYCGGRGGVGVGAGLVLHSVETLG